jgi:hypothetical protein
MGCNRCGKQSLECGDKVYAPCVYVEIDFPLFSEYNEEECVTLDEVLIELYEEVEQIKEDIDIIGFQSCLNYGSTEKTIPNITQKHEDEICTIKTDIENLQDACTFLDMDISGCGIDVSCLQDDVCNNPIIVTTVGALFQTLIDKICQIENQNQN